MHYKQTDGKISFGLYLKLKNTLNQNDACSENYAETPSSIQAQFSRLDHRW